MSDISIPARARSSLNIARKRQDAHGREQLSWSTYRGAVPTVRVFRNAPYTVELQIRADHHYAHATLSIEEAQQVISALTENILEMTGFETRRAADGALTSSPMSEKGGDL